MDAQGKQKMVRNEKGLWGKVEDDTPDSAGSAHLVTKVFIFLARLLNAKCSVVGLNSGMGQLLLRIPSPFLSSSAG